MQAKVAALCCLYIRSCMLMALDQSSTQCWSLLSEALLCWVALQRVISHLQGACRFLGSCSLFGQSVCRT